LSKPNKFKNGDSYRKIPAAQDCGLYKKPESNAKSAYEKAVGMKYR
jgi:hypothetical protein